MADNFLNLANFMPYSRANGPGARAVIWVQGCPRGCDGCFNPELQPLERKDLVAPEKLFFELILPLKKYIEGVTFSGGEPFEQASALARLAGLCQRHGFNVVCFSGYKLEELKSPQAPKGSAELLEHMDLLIDGPYIQELAKGRYLGLRGSTNQEYHLFSDAFDDREMEILRSPKVEMTINIDGAVSITGFPEPEWFREILRV